MAIEIGALRALLSLDSAAFEKGAKRAQASMNGLQRNLNKVSRKMRGIGKRMSLGLTAPMAAIGGAAVRSSLRVVDAQAKMAESLDTSVVSLQNMDRAAELAGISQGELEGSLTRMTRRVSLAEKGTGPAVKALDRLGISAKDLADLPVDERVEKVTTAIRDMIPETEQAGIASEIFGDRTGLAMLRLKPEVIARAADEVRKYGVAVADVDADAIEDANDSISALGLVTRGLANQLTVALAPTLQWLAEKGAELSQRFAALSPEMKKLIGIGAAVAAAVGPLAIGLGAVVAGISLLLSPVGALVFALGAAAGAAAYVAIKWDDLKKRFPILERMAAFGAKIKEKWDNLPSIKWALLIPALRWARFIPGLRWAAFIPKISWAVVAGSLKWGALIARLSWAALRVIPGIGWAALAGSLAWSALVKKIEWNGWIPKVIWRDWVNELNWDSLIPLLDWSYYIPDINWSALFGKGRANINDPNGPLGQMRGVGRDAAKGLEQGMGDGAAGVSAAAAGSMQAAIDASKNAAEVRSPSRVFMRIGRDLMGGLSKGIGDHAQDAAKAAQVAAENITTGMASTLNGFDLSSIPQTLGDGFASAFQSAITGAQSLGEALRNSVGRALEQIGSQLIRSGIGSFGFGGNKASGLLGAFAGLFDKGGFIPSGQFGIAGEYGPEIVTGPAQVTSRADTARMLAGAGGAAPAPQLTYAPVIDARGADAGAVARIEGQLQQQAREFESKVADFMVSAQRTRLSKAWEG